MSSLLLHLINLIKDVGLLIFYLLHKILYAFYKLCNHTNSVFMCTVF